MLDCIVLQILSALTMKLNRRFSLFWVRSIVDSLICGAASEIDFVGLTHKSNFFKFSFSLPLLDLSKHTRCKVETPYHDNDLIMTPIISPQSDWQ
jgi:hypothetical protein